MIGDQLTSLEAAPFTVAPLKEAREDVCSSICFALTVVNLKMVTRKFLSPVDLSEAQTLYVYKTAKVIMIGQDKDLVLATFQIVSLSLKSLNDC